MIYDLIRSPHKKKKKQKQVQINPFPTGAEVLLPWDLAATSFWEETWEGCCEVHPNALVDENSPCYPQDLVLKAPMWLHGCITYILVDIEQHYLLVDIERP